MPGLRFLSVSEMQQNTFSKAQQRSYRVSVKSAPSKDPQNFSKRARLANEPSTPENEPIQKGRAVATLPGNLIHLSQSADGKLRWLPPSSSTSSSLNDRRAFSGCFSGDCGPVANVCPALIQSERERSLPARRKPLLKESEEDSSAAAGPESPSLTSCCQNCIASESSSIHSSETVDDCDVQEASFGSHHVAPSSSELSISSQQQDVTAGGKKFLAGVHDRLPTRTCVLSPYLSSKLKPGKHILGVKKQQLFIRPGQLRHWAVGNSPSLASSLANLPVTSLKGKACRTLAF